MSKRLPFLQPLGKRGKHERPPEEPERDLPEEEDPFAQIEEDPFHDGPPLEAAEEPVPSPPEPDGFAAGQAAYRAGDYPAALEAFLSAAGQGHREAQFLCGQMYRRGIGTEASDKLALNWYKRSAKQGYLSGQMACGSIYEEGRGTEIDLKKALFWYEQAARQGAVEAQLKCGVMYSRGRAETRNPKKARRWLEAAAEQGSEEARVLLLERF